ncbi:MAG: histidine phosphatase family protein, partial [Acidimicrobiales bacterium]
MLLLVRHGETAANAAGKLLGRADPPLTAVGCRQARALAAVLPEGARVISSPLGRAMQTAALLSGVPEDELSVDPRWIELDYGELDGRPAGALAPDSWRRWAADPSWRPPGGESLADVAARVGQACDELAVGGADVVVVSHVSPIKAAVAWALGVGPEIAWRMRADLA